MQGRLISLTIVALILLLSGSAIARTMAKKADVIPANSELHKITLVADISAARIKFTTHPEKEVLSYDIRYDADLVDVSVESDLDGQAGEITLLQDRIKRRYDIDSDDYRWDVSLSTAYTWDLNLDIGFAECRVDLSGLPLSRLRMDIGAAEGRVRFSEANPTAMKELSIDAGAGEFDFIGLGFAGAEHYDIDCGAGEFTLDFTGLTKGFHSARIDVGIGEITLELPMSLPVRIESDEGWFNEITIRGRDFDEIRDGVYETENFDKGDFGLEIKLDVGLGEATIRRADNQLHISSGSSHARILSLPENQRFELLNDLSVLPIPAIPAVPAIPTIPAVPAMHSLPAIIDLPEMPEIPVVPAIEPIWTTHIGYRIPE